MALKKISHDYGTALVGARVNGGGPLALYLIDKHHSTLSVHKMIYGSLPPIPLSRWRIAAITMLMSVQMTTTSAC